MPRLGAGGGGPMKLKADKVRMRASSMGGADSGQAARKPTEE